MVQVNVKTLIDDRQCYQTVREFRWPDGIACPACASTAISGDLLSAVISIRYIFGFRKQWFGQNQAAIAP
jgi:hypothetical protein